MIDKELAVNYKKLDSYDKEHLYLYIALRYCYDYEKSIDDDMAVTIANLAYECLKEDNDNRDINEYTGYILDSVYDYGATLEQIQELDIEHIIECLNNGKSAEDILKIDTEEMNYCFTTIDNLKYYSSLNSDIFSIANENGYKVGETHIMDYAPDTFFDLLQSNKIKDISMYMHHAIRTIIKKDGLLENEEYSKSIKCYEKYCEEHFINSNIIVEESALTGDIDLFDLDKQDRENIKLKKLHSILKNNHYEISNKCNYVASINNGNDYYYNNKNKSYIVIDKENGVKEIKNTPFFILNELQRGQDYIYIKESETKKVINNLKQWECGNSEENFELQSFGKFMNYNEIHFPRYNQTIKTVLDNKIKGIFNIMNKVESDNLKKRIRQARVIRQKMKDKDIEL